MKILNIYVDETGEFGFNDKSSKLYGISFTFHEQGNDISNEINNLNARLKKIGYTGMIHMADLIMKRGDYVNFDINMRKSIFNAIYLFSKKISVKYFTIIIDKKYTNNLKVLKKRIFSEIEKMIIENQKYFNKFKKIILYYDNGQKELGKILNKIFGSFENYEHIIEFNHEKERLFQVSDMLTYIDKLEYKYKNKMSLNNGEKYFFSNIRLKKLINEIENKKLKK